MSSYIPLNLSNLLCITLFQFFIFIFLNKTVNKTIFEFTFFVT